MSSSHSRQLGLYERFSLARSNVGVAPSVVLHAGFTRRSAAENSRTRSIQRAIQELLNEFPLLRGRINGARTRAPRFVERDATQVEEILSIVNPGGSGTASFASSDELLRPRLEEGLTVGDGIDVAQGPLWRVVYHGGEKDEGLMLVVHHTLSDGVGAKNLFARLLERVLQPSQDVTQDLEVVGFDAIPKTQEESVPGLQTLRWTFWLGVIWSELVRSALPFGLGAAARKAVLPNPPIVPPFRQPTALRIIRVSNELIRRVKATARANGVTTLHPILHTALYTALLSTSPNNDSPPDPSAITIDTSMSLRFPSHGHPSITGNYVASASSPPSFRTASLSTSFYALARSYAAHISSPAEKDRAKQMMLCLSLIPDKPPAEGDDETGWEKWLNGKMTNEKDTWSSTIDASNLGVFPISIELANEVGVLGWAQPGSAFAAAVGFNIISSPAPQGEMTVSFSYRKGSIAPELLDSMCSIFTRVLKSLGGDDVDEKSTLQDLAR